MYLSIVFMPSNVVSSGESPPCTARNFPFISHANGRVSKQSINRSYISRSYLCKHSYLKLKNEVIARHS